jgi:hypothetical protein
MTRPLINRPWTAEDDERLSDLLRRGLRPATIAVRLKRTLSSIKRRKQRFAQPDNSPPANSVSRNVLPLALTKSEH